jgi:DNA polymerase-3 subunit alpha
MPDFNFVHLQCQSEFSVTNSLVRIQSLVKKAKELNMNSVALTDESNLFAAVKFYKAAIDADIKPIFGAKITIKDKNTDYFCLLLCQNRQGYLNLSELISLSYVENQTEKNSLEGVFISSEQLAQYNQGLIMIDAPNIGGVVARRLLENNPQA